MASTDQHSVRSDHSDSDHISAAAEDGGWRPGLDPRDEALLTQARKDHFAIVEEIPTDSASLGWYSVSCLIFNRMVGSGVFNSSAVIFPDTQSIGISLLLWLYGSSVAISGAVLYTELGLVVPRYRLGDGKEKISVVRSGGELPYINYFMKIPRFLATCLFGMSFIVFGNTSVNSIAFAVAVLQASNAEQTAGKIAGISVALNTFTCLLHSISRKWGIRINNFFGTTKLAMLFLMVLFGFIRLGKDRSIAATNLDPATSFSTANSPKGIYRFAEAVIFAIFPFSGFHQANYVTAEIRNPRKNFALVNGFGVLLVCSLVVTINVLYAAVIPRETLFKPDQDLALEFFRCTIGRAGLDEMQIQVICGSLRAFSAFGNVIVFTFTAARVKQEIAKEGVLPYSLFFASSYSFSFRHGFRRLPPSRSGYQLYSSRAPAAALALHWIVTFIMIMTTVYGTIRLSTAAAHLPAYFLGIAAFAYGLDILWFSVIGVGMLCLRLWPGSRWHEKSPVPHSIGVAAAVIFSVTNLFPLVAIWIPDPEQAFLSKTNQMVPWFSSQAYGIAVLASGALYWLCFRFYIYLKRAKNGEVLNIIRTPIFWRSPSAGDAREDGRENTGDLLQLYEIVEVGWKRHKEGEKGDLKMRQLREAEVVGAEGRMAGISGEALSRMSGARLNS
ncbi:amino acid permease-domain-containing protein [Podospora didyma]|uniref:Amino acid permease-domain-containing protein n=1 Tax=Podospora didyma TaxID=330526 RepID=A0AAE0U3G9_9PEZI|nr:amino acid permease-domain-containing protein [Podospora didyma]